MIYKNRHGEKGNYLYPADSETAANSLYYGRHLYVAPSTHEERLRLIEMLDENGFNYVDSRTKKDAEESFLPLSIQFDDNTYLYMGNVTCAACAAQSKLLISEKEFYVLYSYMKLAGTCPMSKKESQAMTAERKAARRHGSES